MRFDLIPYFLAHGLPFQSRTSWTEETSLAVAAVIGEEVLLSDSVLDDGGNV